MSISFPRALPTAAGIRGITIRARNVTALSESKFSLKQQVYTHSGQRWEAEIELPPMARADAETWVAFLLSMRGREGTFLLGDPVNTTARGALGGSPLVNGAGQTGDTLTIDGASASVAGWLKAGDWIQTGSGAGSALHKVLLDATTNGAGQVTLDVWPSIRTSPANDSVVVTAAAKGVFRLNTSDTEWRIDEMQHYGLVFAAVEAIV